MKRLIISAVILLVIIGINILEINMLNNSLTPIISNIKQAQNDAGLGNYSSAEALSIQVEKQWQEAESKFSLFINHNLVSDIGLNISKLPALSSSETSNEFLSECNAVLVMLIHIQNNEYPSISNLL